jgi:hypothetical protein
MTIKRARLVSVTALAAASLGACTSVASATPARIADPSAATLARITSALRTALGRPQLELGVVDYRTATAIAVLPSPVSPRETRSLAVPSLYNIMTDGTKCHLVGATDGKVIALDGVRCVGVSN